MDAINHYLIIEVEAAYKKMEKLQRELLIKRSEVLQQDAEMQEMQSRLDDHEDREEEDINYINWLERRVTYTRKRNVPSQVLRRAFRTGVTRGRIRVVQEPDTEYWTTNMRDWYTIYDLSNE